MVVLFGTELLLKLPVVFTNEKYADIHFIYGFCDKSGWVAAVEYHQWYSDNWVPHDSAFQNVHRLLRETYFFSWMSTATAWRRQSYGYSALNLTYICFQNFHEAWYCTDTGIGGFAWRWLYLKCMQNHLLGDHACIVELHEWLQWWWIFHFPFFITSSRLWHMLIHQFTAF